LDFEIARREGNQMNMILKACRWTVFAIAFGLIASGCSRSSPQDQMKAALEAQCKSGAAPCPNPKNMELTVKCQAGDPASCQKLTIDKCETGDPHACQSLAVMYTQLKPLCDAGNPAACRGMKLGWPSSGAWNVEASLAQARQACSSGDARSCRALGAHAQASGDHVIWTQSYVEPADHQ
jgi:hypothetical protein